MNATNEPKFSVGQVVKFNVVKYVDAHGGFNHRQAYQLRGTVWQVLSTRDGYEYVVNVGGKGRRAEERHMKSAW